MFSLQACIAKFFGLASGTDKEYIGQMERIAGFITRMKHHSKANERSMIVRSNVIARVTLHWCLEPLAFARDSRLAWKKPLGIPPVV